MTCLATRTLPLVLALSFATPVAPFTTTGPLSVGRLKPERLPAPACRTGRFVTSTGTLLTGGPATGTSSDTIVLDAQGNASVTSRCTAARARLSSGRKSTRLTVRWPAGACSGVKGALTLTATIKDNCEQMRGRLQAKKVRRRFKAARFVCPPLLRETADGLACSGADFSPGAASTAATLDADGRFPSAITLTTDHGLTVHVDAGTQVHGRDGEVVSGDIEIVLDDGGGVAAFGGPDPIQAIVRLLVRRRSDGAVLPADFDPPAKVDLELGDFGLPGTWLVYAYVDSDGFVTGPGAGAEQVFLAPLRINDDGTEQLVFGNTMVMGLGFAADSASASNAPRALGVTPTPTSTVSVMFPIPSDPAEVADPDARVCFWEVIVPNTGEILMIDLFVQQPPVPRTGPGFGVGESRTKTIRGRTYTAKLVALGGGRALEVTSVYHNRLLLDFRLCTPDGRRAEILRDAQGGCADETCTDVPYDGLIAVTATVPTIFDTVTVRDALRAVTGGGNLVIFTAIRRLPNGRYQAFIKVLSEEQRSVQTIAALLPAEWVKSTTDRQLTIVVPSPCQVTIHDRFERFNPTPTGGIFFDKTFEFDYVSGPVLLKSDPESDDDAFVDDEMIMTVTRPDGSMVVRDHDYSGGCSGVITHEDPVDVSAFFQPGKNQVRVQFKNTCGGNASADSFFLVSPSCP